MFRRRRRQPDAEAAEETTPAGVEVAADVDDDERPAEPPRPQGPWDVADAPEDSPGTQRLDLGGLRVPVLPGLELRIDMDAAQKPVAATVVSGPSAMQVNAFAAPRTEGIWGEVRAEILASLQAGGAREVEGPFGPEVLSKVPAGPPVPGRGTPVVDARFIGVDGPRWFLRGLVSGPAATDRALAAPFEEVLRGVVVVRGGEAMPPREPLPLVLPRQVQEAAAAHAEQQAQGQPSQGQQEAQAQQSQGQQEAQAQALAQQQAQQRAQQQALASAQAQLAAQQRAAAAGPDAGGPPRTGSPQADPREDGPGRTASRRVGGADDQSGDGTREAPGSSAPAPKLSMADQLAQAARAVAARQTGATAGAAAGSTAPAPAVGPPAPAGEASAPASAPATSPAEAPPPAPEPLVASSDQPPADTRPADQPPADQPPADQPPGDREPAAPAPEPPTASPASSEPDLGVLDAPPGAGGGLDPGGPRP